MEGEMGPVAVRLLESLAYHEKVAFESRLAKLVIRPIKELRTFAARRAPVMFGGPARARMFSGDVIGVALPEIVGVELYRYGYFEASLTRVVITHLRSEGVMLDVGAQYGYYSVLSSRLVGPQGLVYAFEPTPRTYRILETNTRKLGNVRCENAAVFSESGTTRIRDFGSGFSAFNTLLPDARLPQALRGQMEATEVEVRTVRLDDYCEDANIHPDFVKVDAESVELQVLEGMERLLIAGIAMLSVETGDYEVGGSAASSECIRYLADLGYSCLEYEAGKLSPHKPRERYEYDNLYFVKPPPGNPGRSLDRSAAAQ
jgi:FkbM family methyltransferase